MFNLSQAIQQNKVAESINNGRERSKLLSHLEIFAAVLNYYINKQSTKKEGKRKFVEATRWAIEANKEVIKHEVDLFDDTFNHTQRIIAVNRVKTVCDEVNRQKIEIDEIQVLAIVAHELVSKIDDMLSYTGKILMQAVYDYADLVNNALREPSDDEVTEAKCYVRMIDRVINEVVFNK